MAAKQVIETPKWLAMMAGDCGHMTAAAPSPDWKSSVPTNTATSTFTCRFPRRINKAPTATMAIKTPSTAVTIRWLNSIAVSTAYSGMNFP